jgi:leader peptidase (prepilin peptidase)/N-methyltransferase
MSEIYNTFIEQMNGNPYFAYTIILIYGLFVGSFLNVVIYRLPIMMTNDYLNIVKDITELPDDVITSNMSKAEKAEYYEMRKYKDMNLALPASRCGTCGTKIKIWHNIPIISYLLLRGKCASCKTPYSPRYLFIELFIGLFWCYVFSIYGATKEFIMIVGLFTALIASAAIDLKHRVLPDSITLAGMMLGIYYNTIAVNPIVSTSLAIEGAFFGYIGTYVFVKGYEKLRGLDIAMGEGDLKLYGLVGAWIGAYDLIFAIILSTIIGLIQFIAIIPFKKKLKDYQLPFGPAIILSLFIFVFYGNPISSIL